MNLREYFEIGTSWWKPQSIIPNIDIEVDSQDFVDTMSK